MRERDVEAMCLWEYARAGMSCDALLIGSDARVTRYQRPTPSAKRVRRLVLLHAAIRMGGLRAGVTRMVWFGDQVPREHATKHEAACRIEAATIASCVPGRTLSSLLEIRKQLYAEGGYRDEWRDHCPGGLTGYHAADASPHPGPVTAVCANQAFDWTTTVTGFTAEELSLTSERGPEVATVRGHWPARRYEYGGCSVPMPDILRR
jgi:Xaa-Pro aminopeptidase